MEYTNLIKRLIGEVLSTPPKKDKCNCGCHTCKNVGNPGPVLNENLTAKIIMSENMKYHVDNKVALTENTFRYGSDAFLDLWAEARYLYSRNAIHVNDLDKEILLETNLGEYGIYEGKKVPLDLPMLEENELGGPEDIEGAEDVGRYLGGSHSFLVYRDLYNKISDDIKSAKNRAEVRQELYNDLEGAKKLKSFASQLTVLNQGIRNAIDDKDLNSIPELIRISDQEIKKSYPDIDIYQRYSPYLSLNEAEKKNTHKVILTFDDERRIKRVQTTPTFQKMLAPNQMKDLKVGDNELTVNNVALNGLERMESMGLYKLKKDINEAEKKKNPPLGKPKRGGSKKFYVYVRNPKTKKIKKVSFGDTTGLSTKINNPEARRAFAARHKCAQKTDKTKASYWSCRIGRYWKSLGGSKNFSGFW